MAAAGGEAWNGPLVPDRIAVVTGGAGAIGAATCRGVRRSRRRRRRRRHRRRPRARPPSPTSKRGAAARSAS